MRQRGARWQAQLSWTDDGRRRFVAATRANKRAAQEALQVLADLHGLVLDDGSAPSTLAAGADEPRPWPLLDLLEVAGCSVAVLATTTGVHARQLYRWLEVGLTDHQADTLAVRVGLHPAEVWPNW